MKRHAKLSKREAKHKRLNGWWMRYLRRAEMFERNKPFLKKVFKYGIGHDVGLRSHKEAVKFLIMVRNIFGYSRLTYSGDIFYTWGKSFRDYLESKPVRR